MLATPAALLTLQWKRLSENTYDCPFIHGFRTHLNSHLVCSKELVGHVLPGILYTDTRLQFAITDTVLVVWLHHNSVRLFTLTEYQLLNSKGKWLFNNLKNLSLVLLV